MFSAMKYMFILLIVFYFAPKENCYAFELPSEERYKAGEKSLQDFQAKAQNSECWKEAIANLEVGCKKLTDIEQSYLAVDFTNCHLKKSGRRTYNCSRDKSIEDCTGNMDDTAFNAYTTFFTHTTNICFYLQSQAWQQRTEDTVSKLSKTSEEVAGQLEHSLKNQLNVLKHQNQSLRNQKEIMAHEHESWPDFEINSNTSTPSHTYNLRPRRSNQSSPYTNRSFLNMPSPSTLQELVQTLKQSSTKYTAVMKKNSRKELFSSDDDE
ncbi:Protein brambleberry [Exaiptasia diaphana]|nr:Protein brambleberry [Exaiptasia diaphana]